MSLRKKLSPTGIKNSFKKKAVGSAPGTLVHVGVQKLEEITIDIYDYSNKHLTINKVATVSECDPFVETPNPTWIQVKGLHDISFLKELWDKFGFHMLIQEDILNTNQRPKVEDYGSQIFIVLKMIYFENDVLQQEQVSIVFTEKFIFSFQESDKQIFLPIKNRLQVENTRMRKSGPDYMAYALFDIIIDYYFDIVERLNNELEEIEEELWDKEADTSLPKIHEIKRKLTRLRKIVWPLRDSINSLLRDETTLIKDETKLFLRDVYDHLFQVIDNIDAQREIVSSLHDMHMTNLSNKMNEVMKVLTIIATIFIPLTFIAGIYGMNFEHMPELQWKWSYPAIWFLMICATIGMIVFFRKKKWL